MRFVLPLSLAACSVPFVETAVPPEVRIALPLPDGWTESEAGCSAFPGAGTTCLLRGRSSFGMSAAIASSAARAAAGGWTETSWDRVPGRIQASYQLGDAHVGLAAHEERGTSLITVTWTGGVATPDAPAWVASVPDGSPGPLDPELAALPWPERTEVVAVATDGPRVRAHLRVPGSPDALLDALVVGREETLRARSPDHRALQVKVGGREVSVVVGVAGDPHDVLVSAWPLVGVAAP